jgi:hypothetical protein
VTSSTLQEKDQRTLQHETSKMANQNGSSVYYTLSFFFFEMISILQPSNIEQWSMQTFDLDKYGSCSLGDDERAL